ncbi:hypothetical protein BGS_1257 [Beggiatoa sp. SS]|nr:hypothetical protein BGS_1257 [Beggiatoa sp. SS]
MVGRHQNPYNGGCILISPSFHEMTSSPGVAFLTWLLMFYPTDIVDHLYIGNIRLNSYNPTILSSIKLFKIQDHTFIPNNNIKFNRADQKDPPTSQQPPQLHTLPVPCLLSKLSGLIPIKHEDKKSNRTNLISHCDEHHYHPSSFYHPALSSLNLARLHDSKTLILYSLSSSLLYNEIPYLHGLHNL